MYIYWKVCSCLSQNLIKLLFYKFFLKIYLKFNLSVNNYILVLPPKKVKLKFFDKTFSFYGFTYSWSYLSPNIFKFLLSIYWWYILTLEWKRNTIIRFYQKIWLPDTQEKNFNKRVLIFKNHHRAFRHKKLHKTKRRTNY